MPIHLVQIRKDKSFTIEGTLDQPQKSQSGKSYVVLSTRGNQSYSGEDGVEYKLGLNLYTSVRQLPGVKELAKPAE